jgi:hypothetical protein
MNINNILTKLDGVKKTGHGRYIAKCPAHADGSPSLVVAERDNRILVKCFAGCSIAEVMDSIGIKMVDLYPASVKSKMRGAFNPFDVIKCINQEALIVLLAARDVLSAEKAERVQLAYDRINEAYRAIHDNIR